jgi:hypothetical protein
MKALCGGCAALVVCCVMAACGDDYEGGGRQNTLPGAENSRGDAAPDVEDEPEGEQDPPVDERDF